MKLEKIQSQSEFYCSLFEQLGSTTKRNEKEQILSQVLNLPEEDLNDFKTLLVLTLDPRINFYMKDLPEGDGDKVEIEDTFKSIFDLYVTLSNRVVTGATAKELVNRYLSSVPKPTKEVMKLIFGRDLRCGVGAATINKVFGESLVYVHPYMRCSLLNNKSLKDVKFPCLSQTKLDGMYVDIVVQRDSVTYMSRQGNILPFNSDRDQFLKVYAQGYVLQGEALVLNEERNGWLPREDNNGYLNSDEIDNSRIVFVVWDIIHSSDYMAAKSSIPYRNRLSMLEGIIHRVSEQSPQFTLLVDTRECNTLEEVIDHFKENRSLGMEGTIVKNQDLIWKSGTSKHQLKLKVSAVGDLKIVGYKMGEGKWSEHVGSLLCQSSCGNVEVSVNCKTDAFRNKATKNIDKWIEEGAVVAVVYNDIITNELKPELYSLYLPRMESDDIRSDKKEADDLSRLQEILDSFEFQV